jgi:Tfp pilus assembly protein PilX
LIPSVVLRSSTSHRPLAKRATRGFTLLITITLLSFIVILLVGLAMFTRVETAVAGNTQRQAQARQNALFALNVAVGQLQKHAGPDARVTATGTTSSSRYYTGVWDATAAGNPALTWLVSGSESSSVDPQTLVVNALNPATEPAGNQVMLVGNSTLAANVQSPAAAELSRRIKLNTVPITSPGVPGQTGNNAVIGRYAWWVGDNGVKADVARTDITSKLNYPPFATIDGTAVAETQTRLLQQTALGAQPFSTASSLTVFDPRDTANQPIALNALSAQQIPFFKTASGATVGLSVLKAHYHSWTVGNFGVLARTNVPTGQTSLRNDLSTNPLPLGAAFSAWADYSSYMEPPSSNPLSSLVIPPENTLRRRYRITPPVTDATNAEFSVTPILSNLVLSFSIHNSSADPADTNFHLEGTMRAMADLWNPYTGALVPEDLEIRISGLPTLNVYDGVAPLTRVNLQTAFGDASLVNSADPTAPTSPPIRFQLPWPVSSTPLDDQYKSWLPGRVHSWSAADSDQPPATGINLTVFDLRDLYATAGGTGVSRDLTSLMNLAPLASGSSANPAKRRIEVIQPTLLTVELRRVLDGVLLATFHSPVFDAFSTPNDVTSTTAQRTLDLTYKFRLADPIVDGTAWLKTPALEVRTALIPPLSVSPYVLPASNPAELVAEPIGTNAVRGNLTTLTLGNSSLLLDRPPTGTSTAAGASFDEDVPLFELPRSPLLSLGQLQHLSIPTLQPFWIGSSAAATGPAQWNNALFDQHFFTGLNAGTTWTDVTAPLPNTLAHVLRRKPDGSAVVSTDFTSDGLSAKYVLQGGAFNLNSTDADAWAAVLGSVRFPAGREFNYLNADPSTGTAGPELTTAFLVADAVLPRFSQSAQETFKATSGYLQADPTVTPFADVHTDYYRRGFRTLTNSQITSLAQAIATAVQARMSDTGPFRSVEEFLGPTTRLVDPTDPTQGTTTGPSLLEQAIIDLRLNAIDPSDPLSPDYPFSSVYLTQSDIMTVLAPVLFVRSDTFTVRAYGEASNPLTGASEGKAWCEAIVQRLPEPLTPAIANQPTDEEYKIPPGDGSRRFRIVSFRWLTKSDI